MIWGTMSDERENKASFIYLMGKRREIEGNLGK